MTDPPREPPRPPTQRRQPLPASEPAELGDAEILARVRAIQQSPNYRRADRDLAFLERDELRAVRLQVEYLKPELLLDASCVEGTVVVFGGTRIVEPEVARRALEEARAALARDPADAERRRAAAVAERRLANSGWYDVARGLGRLVGLSGEGPADCRLVVATGGGPGLMEAANRGAHDVGARTVGLNITLPHEQFPNPYLTPELCFQFRYFALRKLHFLLRAKALVAFPGGYGTLDEVFEVLCLIQTRKSPPLPVVLVGEAYWRRIVDFEALLEEGVIDPEDLELFWFAETAEEVWDGIVRWHEQQGRPLLGQAGAPGEELG